MGHNADSIVAPSNLYISFKPELHLPEIFQPASDLLQDHPCSFLDGTFSSRLCQHHFCRQCRNWQTTAERQLHELCRQT